ncbi:MAG: hypothetical protein IKI26_04075 [Prevotella sp.]|nr:hypothetical protein [Prevotella sp.]
MYRTNGTFCFISLDAFQDLRGRGAFVYDNQEWRLLENDGSLYHVRSTIDRSEMWIKDTQPLPLVVKMLNNKLDIDWTIR